MRYFILLLFVFGACCYPVAASPYQSSWGSDGNNEQALKEALLYRTTSVRGHAALMAAKAAGLDRSSWEDTTKENRRSIALLASLIMVMFFLLFLLAARIDENRKGSLSSEERRPRYIDLRL